MQEIKNTAIVDTAPVDPVPTDIATVDTTPVDPAPTGGGLAAAIARSRTVVQEKEKTPRELKQFKPGVNRI